MLEKIKELICRYIETDENEIKESSRLAEDLGFNSYDFMCMLGEAEDEFDIEIDETRAASVKTVGELISYFEEL